jgi:hypothetical protein
MSPAMSSRLSSDYNAFLFAPIGEEASGLNLSVLSALARQNIDPWQEAATLARLSSSAARSRLAGIISAALGSGSDAEKVAAQLIVLLPRTMTVVAPVDNLTSRFRTLTTHPLDSRSSMTGRDLLVMILVMAGLTIGMNYFFHNHSRPIAHSTVKATATSQRPAPSPPI